MISTVTGYFKDFDLKIDTETEDFGTLKELDFRAAINSIDTSNAQRDAHLKSPDFFNAEAHPYLYFKSNHYQPGMDEAILQGELTIRGITRPASLKVEFGGTVVDPYGQLKAGFTVNGKISRKDFGLTWNAVTEAGSVVVGDEIKIHAEIQLIREAELVHA
jgi:polyisoprenoid-binding protein YceI